jgi:ABC-type Na+ transport system ATPase subunit NatA
MPQEEALYADFSIGETLTFFGWVHGLSARTLKRRKKFLFNLLELTELEDRQVRERAGESESESSAVHHPTSRVW